MRKVYLKLMSPAVLKTDLFDDAYYREQNPDVADSGINAITHYVVDGDREGRRPIAVFDPGHYRSKSAGPTPNVNSLLHYAYVGRYLRRSPSPWFDIEYYLRINTDVRQSGIEPLRHFLKWGGSEGRSPCVDFSSSYYNQTYPEVRQHRLNPLIHYLTIGRFEGYETLPDQSSDGLVAPAEPSPVSIESFQSSEIRARIGSGTNVIDVILPVYDGRAETLSCLYSVLSAKNNREFELTVIDDQIPDEGLKEDCAFLAGIGLFTLLTNEKNRGFVATVNRGFALHHDRDVVILNSDTEVYDFWLDRLVSGLDQDPRIATVTPLSNNATICSYPRFVQDNPYPLELDYAELDAIASEVNRGHLVDVPTGVGFCMMIRRSCIESIGCFDEKAFGRGYGEENDFCQRAAEAGWRNVVATDVFVRHWGGTSFKGEKAKLEKKGVMTVARRHPDYLPSVRTFIKSDPLLAARKRMDLGRLRRLSTDQRNVLIVCHSRGGGTERHVSEDAKKLIEDGSGVFFMRPVRGNPEKVIVSSPLMKNAPNVPPFALSDIDELAAMLNVLNITEVHTHSLVDFTPEAPLHLMRLVERLGARWEINLHDYKVACPRINMVDRAGLYCGEPGEDECNRCLLVRGSPFGVRNIRWWRDMHWKVLEAADEVLVPDRDMLLRLERYFPGLDISVSPHEEIRVDVDPEPRHKDLNSAEKHIVVLGAIDKMKGYDVLKSCALDAKKRKLPLRFSVLGYTMSDGPLLRLGVGITGKYNEEDALDALAGLEPTYVWLPSTWPETYSYTLSIALKCGYGVFAFDIGAIASRLRALKQDALLMPLDWSKNAEKINDYFLRQ